MKIRQPKNEAEVWLPRYTAWVRQLHGQPHVESRQGTECKGADPPAKGLHGSQILQMGVGVGVE